MPPRFPFKPDQWYQPLPKNGTHGDALMRMRPPVPFDLAYLSWGRRQFFQPIEPAKHEGWHYLLVLRGNPTMNINGEDVATKPGWFSVADPDCVMGHRDRPGRTCEVLVWIWRTPPSHSAMRPVRGHCQLYQLGPKYIRRMQELHQECRQAVASVGEEGALRLRATRILIDLCLLDSRIARDRPKNTAQFDLAVEYLKSHLGDPTILRGLARELHVSGRAINQMFHQRAGRSPRAYVHELRMQSAWNLLAGSGESIKAVAMALGYRHPNDFSRAFKQHFGLPASSANLSPKTSATRRPRTKPMRR